MVGVGYPHIAYSNICPNNYFATQKSRPHLSSDHQCLTQLQTIPQVILAHTAQALNFMKCSHLLLVNKLSRNDSMEWNTYGQDKSYQNNFVLGSDEKLLLSLTHYIPLLLLCLYRIKQIK